MGGLLAADLLRFCFFIYIFLVVVALSQGSSLLVLKYFYDNLASFGRSLEKKNTSKLCRPISRRLQITSIYPYPWPYFLYELYDLGLILFVKVLAMCMTSLFCRIWAVVVIGYAKVYMQAYLVNFSHEKSIH